MSSYLKGLAAKVNGVENTFTKELFLKELIPNEKNFYGIREIEELVESIRENGLLHNLVVREKEDGTYEIISGERRYRALLELGYEKVPCQVKKNISDLDAEIMLIQANVESRELTATEKMEGISRLKAIYEEKKSLGEKVPGKIRDLIGKNMGISGVQVGRYQKIDKDLIPELKDKLDKEEITLTQAHTLSSLNEEEQETIHEAIKDLDPKESKEETNILIEGIKQTVESNYDEETLNETYPESKEEKTDKSINSNVEKNVEIKNTKKVDIQEESKKGVLDLDKHDEINELLNQDPNPRIIIQSPFMEGIFYTKEVKSIRTMRGDKISATVGLGKTKSTFYVNFDYIEKVESIPFQNRFLEPQHGYKVNENTYLWFSYFKIDK